MADLAEQRGQEEVRRADTGLQEALSRAKAGRNRKQAIAHVKRAAAAEYATTTAHAEQEVRHHKQAALDQATVRRRKALLEMRQVRQKAESGAITKEAADERIEKLEKVAGHEGTRTYVQKALVPTGAAVRRQVLRRPEFQASAATAHAKRWQRDNAVTRVPQSR